MGAALLATTGTAFADPGNGQGDIHASDNAKPHPEADASTATTGDSGTSGDVNSPQPPSNADQNGTGANTTGPYDSTRDGSASENGNGNGNGNQPCAGCVGKADNKNPNGQQPGPQDANNGYECDGNNGIAKGNPAHTGCAGVTPPPPECDAATQDCTPCDQATEDCNPVTPPEVLPTEVTAPPTQVEGEVITAPTQVEGEALARTGANAIDELELAGLMLVGGALLLTGGTLGRRRAHA